MRVDIPAVVASRPEVVVGAPLGPDPSLAVALADRLAEARGSRPLPDVVVLVAAGSSDPLARADVDVAAADLSSLLGVEVIVAVLSGPGSRLVDVFTARAAASLEVATYLLAEGFFYERMRADVLSLGIPVVSSPLGTHPAVVSLVLSRFDSALALGAAEVL
ncbi:MAG: cobalamin [Pseudonocardiales bacterium]|nr:cobalamin [Pseudonocardiales bacterium]